MTSWAERSHTQVDGRPTCYWVKEKWVGTCSGPRCLTTRLPASDLWPMEVTQEGWRHRLDYDVMKQVDLSLSPLHLFKSNILYTWYCSNKKPNKKKELLREVPTLKKNIYWHYFLFSPRSWLKSSHLPFFLFLCFSLCFLTFWSFICTLPLDWWKKIKKEE